MDNDKMRMTRLPLRSIIRRLRKVAMSPNNETFAAKDEPLKPAWSIYSGPWKIIMFAPAKCLVA